MKKPNLEELRQFVKVHEFPTDLLVETIAECNLDCIMCPQNKLTRPTGVMSFDLWKKIIDEVAEKSPKTKIWPALMGEPLLVGKLLFEMFEYASKKDVYVAMNTNLMAFEEGMIDALLSCGLNEMVVGLDAFTPETYAKIRVNGRLETVLKNLNFILDEKEKRGLDLPAITLQFVVMDENEDEEERFIEYWKNSGRDVKLKVKPRTGWADGVDAWGKIKNVSQEERHLPCTWLIRQMTIFWNGHVPQCDGDYNGLTDYGNVNDDSLYDIWNGKLLEVRERHMHLDFKFSPCDSCDDWQAGMSTNIECGKK